MTRFITSAIIKIPIPFAARVADIFQAEEQIAVEWIAPEKESASLFSGLYYYEKGASGTFTVRGKPAFCTAVIAELAAHGTIIDKRPQNSSMKFWIHLSGKKA